MTAPATFHATDPDRTRDLKAWMFGDDDVCVWFSDERHGGPAVHGPGSYCYRITARLALTFIRHRRLVEAERRPDGILYTVRAA